MDSMINMRGIVKRFYIGQPNELEILHGIDLDVTEGEFLSIVGASGSGKSTLGYPIADEKLYEALLPSFYCHQKQQCRDAHQYKR